MVFKGCIRCGGDVYDEDDIDQVDLVCLQCGFRRTVLSSRSTRAQDAAKLMRWLHIQRPGAA